jgi:hypothetical protein
LSLWDDNRQKEHNLLTAVDDLRKRFGPNIIKRAHKLNYQDDPEMNQGE